MANRIQEFFDPETFTLTYVVWDPETRDAIVIDPVWDYDIAASVVSDDSVKRVASLVTAEKLTVHLILETHAHADHLSGAQRLKNRFPKAKLGVGTRITEVQSVFKDYFDLPDGFACDGSQFDRLLEDGECFAAGNLMIKVIATPGHTPACCSYLIGDCVFTGDALFMPDYGVGRCDFPKGDAGTLFDSVTTRLYSLPESTRVFTGHDYLPGGRALRFESTIGEEKRGNVHLTAETKKADFVSFREQRDRSLKAPRLLFPSIQINIDAGHFPPAHANGRHFLSLPLFKS